MLRPEASATTSSLPCLRSPICQRPGAEVSLHIHTHVREDALALYGFLRPEEKQLFEKLITVSGIGPSLAIKTLSGMAAADMVGAIRGNDFARLTKIPGIGRKTAERMCVELRDKLEGFGAPQAVVSHSAIEEDVISALTNLAISERWPRRRSNERCSRPGGRTSTRSSVRRWDRCRNRRTVRVELAFRPSPKPIIMGLKSASADDTFPPPAKQPPRARAKFRLGSR